MFGKSISTVTLAMLVIPGPLSAAEDMGLRRDQVRVGLRSAAMGAQIGIRVRLGDNRVVRDSQRLALGIAAGPALLRTDGTRINGRILGLTVTPGYGAKLRLAGSDLYTHRTSLGAAEDAKDQSEGDNSKTKQSTGDKAAWVAAVAGGVMAVLLVATAIAFATQGPTD